MLQEVTFMNRIKVDEYKKKKIKKGDLIIDIKSDINILIDEIKYDKYIFNIYDGNINIFSNISNYNNKIKFVFNIYNGMLVLNNMSDNCHDQKQVVNLYGTSSSIKIINSYLCYDKQEIDVEIFHNAIKTKSEVYNYAITKDKGTIKFNLKTKVNKGMKDSKVSQNGRIITLNKKNDNEINPVLLIDEMNSTANHSAYIGEFKNDELIEVDGRRIKILDHKKLEKLGHVN